MALVGFCFNLSISILERLVWRDAEGTIQLRMDLNIARSSYNGDVFFYRARDLIDRMYEENDQEIYDSFFDSGHPSEGDWDTLVWYLDVEIASNGAASGSLTMKDHAGASPLTRAWGSGATEKGAIGTIPSNSGDYSLTVTVRGPSSFIHSRLQGTRLPMDALRCRSGDLIMMHGMTGTAEMMRHSLKKSCQKDGHCLFQMHVSTIHVEEELGGVMRTRIQM